MRAARLSGAALLGVLLALPAVALTAANLAGQLPVALWPGAAFSPDAGDIRQMLFHYDSLPRIVVALASGAALGMAGAVLQHVFANPLAEPGTLGLSAGSQLALVVLLLAVPEAGVFARDAAALAGAALVMALMAALSLRRGTSPMTVVLAGLTIGLTAAAAANVLILFNGRYLTSLFIWSSGSLVQNGWAVAASMPVKLTLPAVALLLLMRPLTVLALGPDAAQALGLPSALVRGLALSAAAVLAAIVTAAVGVFAFLGLAAPALARLAGARTLPQQLAGSTAAGALLLLLADAAVTACSGAAEGIPTGAATALAGAAFLLLFARRPLAARPPVLRQGMPARTNLALTLAAGVAAFSVIVLLAATLGRTAEGPVFVDLSDPGLILALRLPRILAAAACGVLLAAAGVVIQRLTANPLAAPELAGVSAGAACGVIAAMVLSPAAGPGVQALYGSAGALGVVVLLLALVRRSGFSPERVVLVGLTLATAMSALVSILLASGDPRFSRLLVWMAGSTYGVGMDRAVFVSAAAGVTLAAAVPLLRLLDILPLGEPVGRALGMKMAAGRLAMLLLVAGATGTATLVVGPITFVGLLAPVIARAAGARRAAGEILGAALAGAAILVFADWLGRQVAFPRQIPAGLLAAVTGSPVLVWLLWRNRGAR
ncbi:Fe(3+)-hydroxamate ABC transporter permease FhuB [Shinella sp. BYT-45]|uniref:Fe(3+)-hydroxamate ABC transporter permease FhuB n=1 Tax=Shinella sp. BYT-45 TaxID=3377377 RepID=UPI00397F8227